MRVDTRVATMKLFYTQFALSVFALFALRLLRPLHVAPQGEGIREAQPDWIGRRTLSLPSLMRFAKFILMLPAFDALVPCYLGWSLNAQKYQVGEIF